MLHAVWKVRLTPKQIREIYRKRFGIETSYRQMNEARIKTCTRDPGQRLLFVGIALVLRNVWVWLHFQMAKGKRSPAPQIFLKELGGSSVDFQVRVWGDTSAYWDVWQETTEKVKEHLDGAGIGIPYPQMDVHLDGGLDK